MRYTFLWCSATCIRMKFSFRWDIKRGHKSVTIVVLYRNKKIVHCQYIRCYGFVNITNMQANHSLNATSGAFQDTNLDKFNRTFLYNS